MSDNLSPSTPPKKKSGGRPTLCTPEVTKQIAALVMTGNTYACACATVGISYDSFNLWMNRGRQKLAKGSNAEGEQPFIRFFKTIKQADAQAESGMASVVMSAAFGRAPMTSHNGEIVDPGLAPNWNAAAWWLERRRPREYGKHINLDLQVRRFIDALEERGLEFETIAREVLKAVDDELTGHRTEGSEEDAFSD